MNILLSFVQYLKNHIYTAVKLDKFHFVYTSQILCLLSAFICQRIFPNSYCHTLYWKKNYIMAYLPDSPLTFPFPLFLSCGKPLRRPTQETSLRLTQLLQQEAVLQTVLLKHLEQLRLRIKTAVRRKGTKIAVHSFWYVNKIWALSRCCWLWRTC